MIYLPFLIPTRLRDYLPRDIKNARIMLYGYPSDLYGNTSRTILADYSNNFIQRLLTMRESASVRLFTNMLFYSIID